jgi:hypothetical protein
MNVKNDGEPTARRKAKDRDGLYKRRDYWHYELIIDGKKRSFTTGTKDYNEAKKNVPVLLLNWTRARRQRARVVNVSRLVLASTSHIQRLPFQLGLCG